MSTTNLFVELIVIGLGAAIWVASFALAALAHNSPHGEEASADVVNPNNHREVWP